MARKKSKKTEENDIEVVEETSFDELEETAENGEAEEIDFLEYISQQNVRMGTDYRKKIHIRMDNKKMVLAIRPLSYNEVESIRQQSKLGQGIFENLVVCHGAYGVNGKPIPLAILEKDKIPAGVVDKIAGEIMKFTGYGLPEEASEELKKP